MKTTFIINFSEDACILCDLFQCSPADVVQYYIDQVSIHAFDSETSEPPCMYATLLFMQLVAASR
jgi:hypothetical protein